MVKDTEIRVLPGSDITCFPKSTLSTPCPQYLPQLLKQCWQPTFKWKCCLFAHSGFQWDAYLNAHCYSHSHVYREELGWLG